MMRKRNRLLVCLAAGVLILAVSATAAFGSVNGYTKYKEALKSLALETDNFTATGTMQVNYDGKEIASLQQDFAMEGQNVYSHSVSKDASGQMETYDTLLDGVRTEFNVNDKYYTRWIMEPTRTQPWPPTCWASTPTMRWPTAW